MSSTCPFLSFILDEELSQSLIVSKFDSADAIAPSLVFLRHKKEACDFLLNNAENIGLVSDYFTLSTMREVVVASSFIFREKYEYIIGIPTSAFSDRFISKLLSKGAQLITRSTIAPSQKFFFKELNNAPNVHKFKKEYTDKEPIIDETYSIFCELTCYLNAVSRYIYDIIVLDDKDNSDHNINHFKKSTKFERLSNIEWKLNAIYGAKIIESLGGDISKQDKLWLCESCADDSVINDLRFTGWNVIRNSNHELALEKSRLVYDIKAISELLKLHYTPSAFQSGTGIKKEFSPTEGRLLQLDQVNNEEIQDAIEKLKDDGVFYQLESYVQGVPYEDIVG